MSTPPDYTLRGADTGTQIRCSERIAGTIDGGGFGLGLAIRRELARRIDGHLVLAGTDGPGARFELRLSPAPPALPGG